MSTQQQEQGGDPPGSDPPREPAAGDPPREPAASVRTTSADRLIWLPAATLVLGLIITAALVLISNSQYTNNENRLLKLRVRDAAALVTAALPNTQTTLASAAELANATNGDAQKFMHFIAPYVGVAQGQPFVSVSLWRLSSIQRGPITFEGIRPKLSPSTPGASALFARAARAPQLNIIGLLQPPDLRLGYAWAIRGPTGGFATYGESRLPANRRSRLQSSSQFAGLHYALYLGRGERPQDLLVSDLSNPPAVGRSYADTVPFGTTALTLVMSTRQSLAGSLPQELPWIILVVGVILSVAAAWGTMRLLRRRRDAERLAGRLGVSASESHRLYAEQRSIAQTLQHALLPDKLPQLPGIETSALYQAGERGVDIGGDWYDVIHLNDHRLLLVVGDVSGRGLAAATTMASLRYAIHAYATQNDSPPTILNKLSHLVDVAESGKIATILCALVDVPRREIGLTSAGHLPPLLLSDGGGRFVHTEVGLPIGVETGSSYTSVTISAPHAATLVAFTDGLVEQRGEDLDQGLSRLRDAAASNHAALPDLLNRLARDLPNGPSQDDIAIVGVRWTS